VLRNGKADENKICENEPGTPVGTYSTKSPGSFPRVSDDFPMTFQAHAWPGPRRSLEDQVLCQDDAFCNAQYLTVATALFQGR
jgi:hypothetical protein